MERKESAEYKGVALINCKLKNGRDRRIIDR